MEKWYIIGALRQSGCAICRLAEEAESRHLYWFLNEEYYLASTLEDLLDGGLCNRHAWALVDAGGVYQQSAMYQWLAQETQSKLARHLDRLKAAERPRPWWAFYKKRKALASPHPPKSCPICHTYDTSAAYAAHLLVTFLRDPETLEAFRASPGICLPHLRLALEKASPEQGQVLLTEELVSLRSLGVDLAEYLRKTDYRYAHEPKGEEQHAWRRAAALFSGKRRAPAATDLPWVSRVT